MRVENAIVVFVQLNSIAGGNLSAFLVDAL